VPPSRTHSPLAWLFPVTVATLTFVVFLPVLAAGFVNYDDDRLVLHNPYLRLPWMSSLEWMWSTTYMGHYQPLSWMSLAVDHAVAGTSPLAYHLDSLLWHTAGAVLLYFLLVELLTRVSATASASGALVRASAALGALFWSIHPLRVESVAWIAERRDPISLVFWLLALFAYIRSVDVGRIQLRSLTWYLVSCVSLVLSLLAKAWGMTFFVTLVALDWYPLDRIPLSRTALTDPRYRPVWLQKMPFAVLGLGAGALAWAAQHAAPDTMLSTAQWSIHARMLQAAYGLCFYPLKTLWPSGLAALYELPPTLAAVPASYIVCACVVAAAAVVTVWFARQIAPVTVALIAYAATVAPVLGFAQSGPQLVADRYSYLSCLAFSALLAGGLLALRSPLVIRAARLALGAFLVASAVLTWRQATAWHDSIGLWAHALDAGHPGYVAHLNYGQALRAAGRTDEAIAHYRQALAIRPTSGNAWYNLANALKAQGQDDDAVRAYEAAIQYLPRKVEAQVNLGNLYFSRHQLAQAIEEYRRATAALDRMSPSEFSPEPYLYLGMALADSGDRDGARRALEVALRYPATRARAEQEWRRLP